MDDLEIVILLNGAVGFEREADTALRDILLENMNNNGEKISLNQFFDNAKIIKNLNKDNNMWVGKSYCG